MADNAIAAEYPEEGTGSFFIFLQIPSMSKG